MAGELVHVPEEMTDMQLQQAISFLERCWFIGFTETSETDIPLVCRAVGVRPPHQRSNVSRQHLDPADVTRVRRLIESRDELDMQLYEAACRLRGIRPSLA